MSKDITTRDGIPTQNTGGGEDLPPNYAEILQEVKHEVRVGYVRAHRAANNEMARAWPDGVVPLPESQLLERRGLVTHNEKLEDALVGDIVAFLQELGVGFAFVGRQYVLRAGGEEFRPDLLFYHLNLRRFVVIELKTSHAEPAHVGQLGFYTAVIDDKVRDPERDGPTIGLLIAKSKNGEVIDYALHTSRQPMAVSTYTALEPEMKAMLPESRALSRIVDETIAEHSAKAGPEDHS